MKLSWLCSEIASHTFVSGGTGVTPGIARGQGPGRAAAAEAAEDFWNVCLEKSFGTFVSKTSGIFVTLLLWIFVIPLLI